MTIRHLNIFLAVCECESVTAAAKKLYMSQPAVSLALSELEKHYGVKLFERYARGLQITEAGRDLYGFASHIISTYEEMETQLKSFSSEGRIRMGASITVGTCIMPKLISDFKELHPMTNPYVKIDSSDVIERHILENKLDLAVIEGSVHSENIYSEKLLEDDLVVICSEKNPLRHRGRLYLADLEEQNFLLREKNSGTRELIESAFLTKNFSVNPLWESTSTEALIHAVAQDHGISVLPRRLIESRLEKQPVVQLTLEDVSFSRCFYLIHHKNKFLTRLSEDMIELVRMILV